MNVAARECTLLLSIFMLFGVSASRAQDQSNSDGRKPPLLARELRVAGSDYDDDTRPRSPGLLYFMGGVDVPVGDFAATHSDQPGGAKTGTSFGLGYSSTYSFPIGAEVSFTYTSNPTNSRGIVPQTGFPSPIPYNSGSWTFLTPLAGLRLGVELGGIGIGVAGSAGFVFARTPDFSLLGNDGLPVKASSSATAFAYGGLLHIIPSRYISFIIQGLSAKPEFSASASGTSVRFTQPMTNVQLFICLGM